MSSSDISRVYQFLAKQGDWVSAADKNGDGAVIKTEFRNFMEENFEWDGETTTAGKNDLINSFWNTIDTSQSGKISGTNLKDKNALNSKEIEAMQNRIEMYEILNNFTSSITAPGVVSDATGWKKSVSEGIEAIAEQYINSGGNAENLEAYLLEKSKVVEQKATADYCANDYLKDVVGDFVSEYNYSYADDSTLQSIIDTYIQNIPADETFEDIKENVMSIIDAYLSTAGINESEDPELLAQYGYTYNQNSALNDLQKSIIKKNIENALQEIKNNDNYEANSALYDSAINDFITNILTGAKFSDFNELKEIGMSEFEYSENYKNIEKTIEVQNIFGSEEFITEITNKIGETFAEKLAYIMPGEITAYDNIINEALTKTQNGDFNSSTGELDKNKLIDWITNEIKENLAEFYPNGFGDMSVEELNTTFDTLVESAREQKDAAKIKKAALNYCSALCDKSTSLAAAVEEVFGSNYTTTINKLLSGEIIEKMNILKEMALENGDISTFSISSWNGLPNEVSLGTNSSKNYQLNTTVVNGNDTISADRISYSTKVKSGTGTATIDGNTLTITGSSGGYTTVEVSTLVDGIEIGTQLIKVHVVDTKFDWGNIDKKYNGYISDGSSNTPNSVKTIGELYNNNGVINLLPCEGMYGGSDWKGCVAMGKANIANFVNGTLVEAIKATGNYETAALSKAAAKVISLYNTAFDHSLSNWADKKSDRDNLVTFDGENYGYQVAKWYSDNTAQNTSYSAGCSASNNQLGLRISEGYDHNRFQITVNAKCVMDLFNKFYEQALTA